MKYLVIIPTYNEKENIERLIDEILKFDEIDILVVDDNSPDQTGKIVQAIALNRNKVHLLNRTEKTGLGTAYRDGFKWALECDYDFLISMDADFSHPPEALEKIKELTTKNPSKIILGSRYVKGGQITGWDFDRYLNSYLANFVVRLMLFLKPHDATSGFKAYPASFIRTLDLDKLVASGYAFQVEMLVLAKASHIDVIEFPIIFRDREFGESKISGELPRSIKIVWKLFFRQEVIRNLIKFCVVGFICVIIDWTIFFLLKKALNVEIQSEKQLIKALSFVFSASLSYILNRIWTFRSEVINIAGEALKFFLIATIGLGLNNLFFYIFNGKLGLADLLSLVLATILVFFWNFTFNRLWVFKQKVIQ